MISAPLIEYLKKGIFTFLGTVLAVYLFVILLTYTGNDPSWSHISSDMTTINNMGGSTGAWLSDLFYSFFGFGAWWLLAFLIYESILIWWDNKPTFWLLRLVAYVFLLLSSSALFAQLIALVQQVANPIMSGLEGVAGGIIGLELQARLTQLLSSWGSALFLSIFVVITTTFAFNIHWQALYRRLTDLSWLGSGIRATPTEPDTALKHQEMLKDSDEPLLTDALTHKAVKTNKPDYGQLPLELPTAQASANHKAGNQTAVAASHSGRFSNALTDFLAKSGLGASARATFAAESAASQNAIHNINTAESQAAAMPTRKVEPSFAWNDASIIHDLLATKSNKEPQVPAAMANATPVTINTNTQPTTELVTELEPLEAETAIDATDSSVSDVGVMNADAASNNNDLLTTNVDALADSWLAEHKLATHAKESVDIKESIETASTPVVESLQVKPAADMTPTNTPPANPKAAPTLDTAHSNTVSPSSKTEPVIATKPKVNFAIPEGDSSNYITDMMPDDTPDADFQAPVMTDIHDDAAFATRSRAMQTSEYRSQLTPIPEISLLDNTDPNRKPSYTTEELEQLSELLEIKLQEFNVKAEVVNAIPGPVVTRFEVDLAAGVKASKVTGISRDLARSLSMASLRVVEVIPGKPYIGIEVPNKQREMVRLIELLNTKQFNDPKIQISMAMGKDIGGNPIITDLARAPHMLVAGTTGSGKSVLVNSMLLSILLKYTPNELRLILIDTKQLELANYNDIPHLLTPVVTDMTEAASSLSWCVAEMERRYHLMSLLKVRKLSDFNKKVHAAEKAGKPMLDPLWRPNDNVSIDQAPKLKTLPMIVIVADEFADMIMQVGKQAEELITRLAQKSRAAGIHLMLATQRPSVDVITGLIKANIPVRAALRVNSKVDSRTILDSGGAEDMLGNGDMLFLGPGQIEPDRVHGAYVSDEEVNRVCDAWRERGAPDYIDNMAGNFELSSPGGAGTGSASGEDDELYDEAVAFIMETRKVSASSIQRKFSIGYNRAARIVDSMEEAGLVSAMGKSGKRELLM